MGFRMGQHKHDGHNEGTPHFGTHVFGTRICVKLDLLYLRYVMLYQINYAFSEPHADEINFVTVKFSYRKATKMSKTADILY